VKEFPENKSFKILARKNTRAFKESDKKARKLARRMFGPRASKKLREEAGVAAKEKTETGCEDDHAQKSEVAKKDIDITEVKDEEMAGAKSNSKPAKAEAKPTD